MFDRPISELRAMVEAQQVECYECEAKGRVGKRMAAVEVYDDPWQEEPTIIYVCQMGHDRYGSCFDRLTDTSWADFRYFTCDSCYRMVISQCPSNGWHSYVRVVNECEEVCLKCYEEGIYENGLSREPFEERQIPGMFFGRGDLEEHGFVLVPDFDGAYINSQDSVDAFCHKALALMDEGRAVAVDYESMGIGGSEGYASLYAR